MGDPFLAVTAMTTTTMMTLALLTGMAAYAAGADIMVLGDSWAEMSRTWVGALCKGKTSVNRGVGGSTAAEWTAGSCTRFAYKKKTCSATDAFSNKYGSGYTNMWLSVGGNDYTQTGCALTKANLQAKVTAAINTVKAAAPAGMKILMTGYCVPSKSLSPKCGKAQFAILSAAIKAAAAADSSVTFVDISNACGANPATDTWSDNKYFSDAKHLNQAGYTHVFSLPAIQSALGCEAGPIPTIPPAASSKAAGKALAVWIIIVIAVAVGCPILCCVVWCCCIAGATGLATATVDQED